MSKPPPKDDWRAWTETERWRRHDRRIIDGGPYPSTLARPRWVYLLGMAATVVGVVMLQSDDAALWALLAGAPFVLFLVDAAVMCRRLAPEAYDLLEHHAPTMTGDAIEHELAFIMKYYGGGPRSALAERRAQHIRARAATPREHARVAEDVVSEAMRPQVLPGVRLRPLSSTSKRQQVLGLAAATVLVVALPFAINLALLPPEAEPSGIAADVPVLGLLLAFLLLVASALDPVWSVLQRRRRAALARDPFGRRR